MNTYIPFVCLALGAAVNWRGLPAAILKIIDIIMNAALIVLMLIIGLNVGVSNTVMNNIGKIGFNCIIIALAAIWCSVLLVFICEKTVMPLEKILLQVKTENSVSFKAEKEDTEYDRSEGKSGFSPLIAVMPVCILIGIIIGAFVIKEANTDRMNLALTIALIFLYTGVGVSLASNKSVFSYIKKLGIRILLMPAAIFAGCLAGGFAAGFILNDVPLSWSVISAGGMGYYSLNGAFLTETYGIEAGTYGFIVNVIRDVFTVLLMPVFVRISKGSPIASGAAGCMDTMLVPVSRAVGPEMGLAALISGTILTFIVPVWQPLGAGLF